MIKNWTEFIKESFEVEKIYRFSDEKIEDLFVELKDEGTYNDVIGFGSIKDLEEEEHDIIETDTFNYYE